MTMSQGSLPSSTTPKKKNKEMTMSQGGSLSSVTLDKKKQIDDDEPRKLTIICYT